MSIEETRASSATNPAGAGTGGSVGGRLSSNRGVAVVQADYLALANDLDQAHALTSSLELQLSGKANELAQLKMLWERTRGDMRKFELDLESLRRERHSLANQVQNGLAAEHLLQKLKREHEQLKARAEALEDELSAERTLHIDSRRCVSELQQRLEKTRAGSDGAVGQRLDGGTRAKLQDLREHLDMVLGAQQPKRSSAPAQAVESIEISFSA